MAALRQELDSMADLFRKAQMMQQQQQQPQLQ
jgi:hypothetical protein